MHMASNSTLVTDSATGRAFQTSVASFSAADWLVLFALLGFGALQFFCYLNSPDLVNDARYYELTRSMLENGSYQFDFKPETLLPPGLPFLLAAVSMLWGSGPGILYHVMAVSATLGLFASYALLRRSEGRPVAAVACLLFGSAPTLFDFSTRVVFSDMPYFFLSTLTLVLILKAESTVDRHVSSRWKLLAASTLVWTILVRSAGLAILIAAFGWVAYSLWKNSPLGLHRLKLIFVPFVAGCIAQLIWVQWGTHKRFTEWPIPGYPGSYLSQLLLKSGNNPELGMATWKDLPERIGQNIVDRSVELLRLLTHLRWINPHWCSPAVVGIFGLISLGLIVSIRRNGGQLHDWYFAANEVLYLLWPWNFEMRFLLPTVPLACLYLWRGGLTIWRMASHPTRTGAFLFIATGLVLTVSSWPWYVASHGNQPLASIICWSLLFLTGIAMLLSLEFRAFSAMQQPSGYAVGLPPLAGPVRALAVCLCLYLVVLGTAVQLRMAKYNTHFDPRQGLFYPDIEAAQWIRDHEPPDIVVMARKEDLVFHYSHHRVIWLPPVTNTVMLLDGIRKYHIQALVVVDRNGTNYWLPSDQDCFHAMQRAYGSMFHLVHRGPHNWVFAIDSDSTVRHADCRIFTHRCLT